MKFKKYKNFEKKKFRKNENTFLIEGWRGVSELLNSNFQIETVLIENELNLSDENNKVLNQLKKLSNGFVEINKNEFQNLSETVNSQGIIAEVEKPNYNFDSMISSKKNNCTIIALDEITDPGNLGTIIRICDWFGVDAILIGKNSCELYNPKVIRSSVGSILHLPIFEKVNLEIELKKIKNFQIIGADLKSKISIEKFKFKEKVCIIIGSEARGISNQLKKIIPENFIIPKFGKAESLNAAVSLSVALTKRFL